MPKNNNKIIDKHRRLVAKRLNDEREQKGWTQTELIKVFNTEIDSEINQTTDTEMINKLEKEKINEISTISGYEIGNRQPNLKKIQIFAKIFNVSSDYLLGITDDRRPLTTTVTNESELKEVLGLEDDDIILFRKAKKDLSPEAWEKVKKEIEWLQQLEENKKKP